MVSRSDGKIVRGFYADGGFEKGKWDGKEESGRKGKMGLRERTDYEFSDRRV